VDVVYLDPEHRVLQNLESFPASAAGPGAKRAASALVLPVHTIYSSQTQPGDQLVICVADEMQQRLARLSASCPAQGSPQGVQFSTAKQPEAAPSRPTPVVIRSRRERSSLQGSEAMSVLEPKSRTNPIRSWLAGWLSHDRRGAHRLPLPGLVAYYRTGSAPRAYRIADISSNGFYLLTEERWFPGTMVLMTLQRTDSAGKNLEDAIAVQSRVVRWGADGLGLAFVVSRSADGTGTNGASFRETGADRKTLERFLLRLREESTELRVAGGK